MAKVDIDNLAPWDLTLTIGGRTFATAEPTWNALDAMAAGLASTAGDDREATDKAVSEALRQLAPADCGEAIGAAPYGGKVAALVLVQAYWNDWLKKKGDAIREAAGLPKPKTASETAGKTPSPTPPDSAQSSTASS